jgi:hypothetical protein
LWRGTGERFATKTIKRSLSADRRAKATTLSSAAFASIHQNPDGSWSSSHSAGSAR